MANYFDYGKREATEREIQLMKRINTILDTMNDDMVERINNAVYDCIIEHGTERRRAYSIVYRFACKYGMTVNDVVDGFFTD